MTKKSSRYEQAYDQAKQALKDGATEDQLIAVAIRHDERNDPAVADGIFDALGRG